jgi:hypothetical protein
MNSETEESATRIRATLASANLCGREERSILTTAPAMLSESLLVCVYVYVCVYVCMHMGPLRQLCSARLVLCVCVCMCVCMYP